MSFPQENDWREGDGRKLLQEQSQKAGSDSETGSDSLIKQLGKYEPPKPNLPLIKPSRKRNQKEILSRKTREELGLLPSKQKREDFLQLDQRRIGLIRVGMSGQTSLVADFGDKFIGFTDQMKVAQFQSIVGMIQAIVIKLKSIGDDRHKIVEKRLNKLPTVEEKMKVEYWMIDLAVDLMLNHQDVEVQQIAGNVLRIAWIVNNQISSLRGLCKVKCSQNLDKILK